MLELKATLRISSEKYSLPDLEKLLGPPSHGYAKGDAYSFGKRAREQSQWALESSSPPTKGLDSHIKDILAFLDSKKAELAGIRNECDLDVFCMLSSDNGQGSTTLSSEVMEELSRYRLDIVLDVYAE